MSIVPVVPPQNVPPMRAARESLPSRLLAPCRWARSTSAAGRASRVLVLLSLLAGQIGLPNLSAWCASRAIAETAEPSGCRCSLTLRRAGRCCCQTTSAAGASSCCTKKPAAAKSTCRARPQREAKPPAPRQMRLVRDACGCGEGSTHSVFRCVDPRVMPPRLVLSSEVAARPKFFPVDESRCGELLPPPLPPPKSLLG